MLTYVSSASQPVERPGCARCKALEITLKNSLLHPICETCCSKDDFPTLLCHGDSFILLFNAFFFIDRNVKAAYKTTAFHTTCKTEC